MINEFESFLMHLSEVAYDIDRDRDRLREFLEDAKRHQSRLNRRIGKTKATDKLRKLKRQRRETDKYIDTLEKGIRKSEHDITKINKFVDYTKRIKLIVMSHKIGGTEECLSTNSDVQSVKRKLRKFSGQQKGKG